MTEELQALLDRMTAMVEDYNARTQAAANRIVTLGNDLQAAKEAMNAAAAADDSAAYQEAESRMRFLTARIEAAKREQVEPLFATREEASALDREYYAALCAAIKPICSRFLETMDEQKTMLEELKAIEHAVDSPVERIRKHASKVGRSMHSWSVHKVLTDHFCETLAEAYLRKVVEG